MRQVIKTIIRKLIIHSIYVFVPDSYWVKYISYLPAFQAWRKARKGKQPMFLNRFLLYDFLSKEIISGRPIQYLEFGVYKGETIKYFAGINSNIDSRFVGFDSFTGLPEAWQEPTGTMQIKTFDTGGEMPQTTDSRISFVKGYFQTSLPGFLQEYQALHPLVMHIDCDLYSSTLYVLTSANHLLVTGSIVIFDEFFSVMHEFRALDDYCSSYMRDYTVVATTKGCGQIAIRMH